MSEFELNINNLKCEQEKLMINHKISAVTFFYLYLNIEVYTAQCVICTTLLNFRYNLNL